MKKFLSHLILCLVFLAFPVGTAIAQGTTALDSLETLDEEITAQDSLNIFNLNPDSTYTLTSEELVEFLLRSCTTTDTILYIPIYIIDTVYITDTVFVTDTVYKKKRFFESITNMPQSDTTITAGGDTIINKHQKFKNVMRGVGIVSLGIVVAPFAIAVAPFAAGWEVWRRIYGDKKRDCPDKKKDKKKDRKKDKKKNTWSGGLEMR